MLVVDDRRAFDDASRLRVVQRARRAVRRAAPAFELEREFSVAARTAEVLRLPRRSRSRRDRRRFASVFAARFDAEARSCRRAFSVVERSVYAESDAVV